jgi:hypothetical protein
MTLEIDEKLQSLEEAIVIMKGQIGALTGLVTHLLCLSTFEIAVNTGETNVARSARDAEELAFEQTTSVIKGNVPGAVAEAKRFQREIFKTVKSQLEHEVRILKMAALNEDDPPS